MFSHHSNPNNFTQLTPSQIHFVRDYSTHCFEPDANLLNALSSQISKLNELPKIQVVERNGAWFALNNSYLHVLRELEKQGKCLRTQVDVVPLSRVPKTVQETMVVVSDDNKWERIRNNNQSLTLKLDDEHNGLCSSETHLKTSSPSDPAFLDANFRADNFNAGGYFGKEADSTKECHSLMNKVEEDELKQGCSHDAPELHGGPGRLTKRGYHKLSDGGCGGSDECPIVPLHDSETEGTSTSSFSGTDCSDFDPDGEVESDSESEEALTCNVCDRSFPSTRKLAQHQQRKRHFGCSVCDSIFPTLMTLELHKESLEHWSDDEGIAQGGSPSDEDSDDDHDDDDDDNIHSPTEELERLL